MEIEKQILNQPLPVAVDREEVRTWVESERAKVNRRSVLKLTGTFLLFGCLLAFVYQLLEYEARQVKKLVGTYPNSNTILVAEITSELCGQKPAEYWVWQVGSNGSRSSLASF